jgi:hypothetical protein
MIDIYLYVGVVMQRPRDVVLVSFNLKVMSKLCHHLRAHLIKATKPVNKKYTQGCWRLISKLFCHYCAYAAISLDSPSGGNALLGSETLLWSLTWCSRDLQFQVVKSIRFLSASVHHLQCSPKFVNDQRTMHCHFLDFVVECSSSLPQ